MAIFETLEERRKRSSLISEEPKCRICFSNSANEKLISPCRCTGSVGSVHKSCLECWLETQRKDECELCTMIYAVTRIPRRFDEYILSSDNVEERRNLIKDLVIIILLVPVIVLTVTLCIKEAVSNFASVTNIVPAVSFSFLAAIVISAFFLYITVTVRHQYKRYSRWKVSNCKIRLMDNSPAVEGSMKVENDVGITEVDGDSHLLNQSQSLSDYLLQEDWIHFIPVSSKEREISQENQSSSSEDQGKPDNSSSSHNDESTQFLERSKRCSFSHDSEEAVFCQERFFLATVSTKEHETYKQESVL